MIFISDIPHLKVFKQKAQLPVDQKAQSMYSIVFINNGSLDASMRLIENKNLYHNNKFHFYYMDSIYKGKLANKTYRKIYRKEREAIYGELESGIKFLNTVPSISNLNERNVYFDLATYNTIYFDFARKLKYDLKTKGYIDYLKNIINDPRLDGYKIKTIVVGMDDWRIAGLKRAAENRRLNFDNPVLLLYFAMYKYFDKFKELGDVNIVFYNNDSMMRVNPAQCDDKSFTAFRREISKIHADLSALDDEKQIEEDAKRYEIFNDVAAKFIETYKFTGNEEESPELEESVKDRLEDVMEEEKVNIKDDADDIKKKLEDKLIVDQQLLKKVYDINQSQKTGRSTLSIKRDQELREKQRKIKLERMTLEEIQKMDTKSIAIPSIDVSNKVTTTNKNMTTIKYPHFEKAYNETLSKKDLVNIITSLNDKSIPVYVRNIEVVDSSDEMNFKETYIVDLEDANRVRHRLRFDVPKFIDDKFMYLGGNKKLIVKQLFMKPVVKTGPDEVQVCSNYNKMFIRRFGTKVSSKIEKFKKALLNPSSNVKVKYGNNLAANSKYKSILEYDELSKIYSIIKVNNAEFVFNQDEVRARIDTKKYRLTENDFCIGFFLNNNEPILMDLNTQMMGGMDIIDFILSCDQGKLVEDFDSATAGKKFMYTKATIMSKNVPVLLLLGYVEGITSVLRKANIRHHFSDTRPKVSNNEGVVQFADGYLVYDKYPYENSLLLNAFADIPTKAFDYADFDGKDAYLSIFEIMFNNKMIGNAFDNFYDFMIDPITKEVLEDLNYPTDFVSLILFANSLLADNSSIKENNMNIYRVRSNEIVNAILYKQIADAYSQYRITAYNNNPVKISVPQDIVLKKLLTLQTVEDYSILNPIVELEKSRAITPKGHVGMNLPEAYTQDKRSYDPTMMGILSISTSPDANCGVVRQLSLEPNIVSPRGYIEVNDDRLEKLTDANLFSPAELLSPLGVTRDDSIRTAMATKQSKHIIPIAKSSPVLISNGSEQVIHYHLSNDFIVRAKLDGEVVEVNEDAGIAMVKYKDGSVQAIDTQPRVVKNGAGGFFLSNQLSCNLKKGQKFKENDILASDKHFFSESPLDGNRFNIGSLQKVACLSTYSTYEDSTFVTKKLSYDMAADVVMQKVVSLGKNANVDYIVDIGQKVQVGDELIRFETSFDDDSLNKFLASVGNELKEEIKSLGKTPIKSKYSGVIEDIKIYSTVELEELSPTLRKIVSDYYEKINKKKKIINKYDKSDSVFKAGVLLNDATGKIEAKDGKIKGTEVGEGVLIEFYIKYKDTVGVGDKITFFTALKSIIGEVIPEGYEPYSEFRSQEEVSSVIAPGAVLARMTPSILLTMFGNKVLVEMKRKLQEIYSGKPWEPVKESMGDIMARCVHCGALIGYEEAWNETGTCPDCGKDYRGNDGRALLEATLINLYKAKNVDDNPSYFTKKEFSEGEIVCPILDKNNKLTVVGHYIKPSNKPTCKVEGDKLVAVRQIKNMKN